MFKNFLLIILGLALTPEVLSLSPWPAKPSGIHIPLKDFESSGAVYDPDTDLVYVVHDQGSIASISKDGQKIRYVKISKHLDLEAIASTANNSGFLYVGVERKEVCYFDRRSIKICNQKKAQIWQIDINTLQPTNRKWVLDMRTGYTRGLEGLTWIPNGSHPYEDSKSGGVFYASSQKNGHVYVYEIDFKVEPNKTHKLITAIDEFQPFDGYSNNDISDLYFDPSQNILYALYDKKDKLVEIDTSTKYHRILNSYNLPGKSGKHEGITLLPSCYTGSTSTTIYLTDDRKNRGLYLYTAFPTSCSKKSSLVSFKIPHSSSKRINR